MTEFLAFAGSPAAAPAAGLGLAVLLAILGRPATGAPVVPALAAPMLAALVVLVLALFGRNASAAFRPDDMSYGFGCALALLGISGADAADRTALSGPRLLLLRACLLALTAFAILAVRLADPFLALASLFFASGIACGLTSLARGPLAARAAFRLLTAAVLAAAFCLAALLLAGTAGASLLLATGLLAFTAVWPFGAAIDAAAARAPEGAAPLILLGPSIAGFALLLRILHRLVAIPGLGTAVPAILFGLAIVGLLDASRRAPDRPDARRPAGFFLGLALAAAALGGPVGFLASLLCLAVAVLVVPAAAAAPGSPPVRMAAAALAPFGGAIPLALAVDRADAVSPVLAAVLAAACLPVMASMLRTVRPAASPHRTDAAPIGILSLVLLLILGLAMPDRVADTLLASAESLAAPLPSGAR